MHHFKKYRLLHPQRLQPTETSMSKNLIAMLCCDSTVPSVARGTVPRSRRSYDPRRLITANVEGNCNHKVTTRIYLSAQT